MKKGGLLISKKLNDRKDKTRQRAGEGVEMGKEKE